MKTNLKETNVKHRTENLPIKVYRERENNDHWHDEYEFVYPNKGSLEITINGKKLLLSPGDAVLIHGRDIHSMRSKGDCPTTIVVHPEFWEESRDGLFWGQIRFQQHFSANRDEDAEIVELIRKLPALIEEKPQGYAFRIKATLCRIFDDMLEKGMYTESEKDFAKHKEEIISLSDYIYKNFSKRITLDDLCEQSHFSRSYVIRLFKESTGKTPMEYINSYRLYTAASRLRETNDGVLDIAIDCGFPSVGYFIRSFKAHFGKTPGLYRRTHS